jgi:hypothetical protein
MPARCRPRRRGFGSSAKTLRRSDKVALETTMNTAAIVGQLAERTGQVVVSSRYKTRAIAEAKIKTANVDPRVPGRAAGG